MKSTTLCVVLSSIIPTLNAHWTYPIISVNGGTPSTKWQYVRKLGPAPPPWSTPDDPQRGSPHRDIYSDEVRCGRESFASAKTTETLVVNAGDEITFFSHAGYMGENNSEAMYHPGVAQVYLSKPESGELEDYRGDGAWFKIKNYASTDGKTWDLKDKRSLNATIPKTTPPGKYLLKVEYFAYHQATRVMAYEFYLGCAHIEIKGAGGGTPGPLVKFPGAHDMFDRSIWRPHSMGYWGLSPGDNYKNPGPEVWTG